METKQTSPLVWLGLAIVLGVGLMALFAALVMPFGFGGSGMMGAGMGWGAVFMVVPAVFLILILLAALGIFSPSRPYVPSSMSALETLSMRYARGEISQEEYLRMRTDLESRTH